MLPKRMRILQINLRTFLQTGNLMSGWLLSTVQSNPVIDIRYQMTYMKSNFRDLFDDNFNQNVIQIRGTPTIRVFHPMTVPNHLDSSFYGFEVPVKHDMEFFKVWLIQNFTFPLC